MVEEKKQLHGMAYDLSDVIHFQGGVPGFESLTRYLLSMSAEHEPFVWLNSVDDPKIRFLMINPLNFRQDYSPKLSKEQIADLQIEDGKDLLLFVIVTLKPVAKESTANLSGPVLINIEKKIGKQVILDDGKYTTRELLMPEEL
ncbi:MAG: flagellar assembly protein FliW [Fibrobacter sp.]|nr:flagellar assembly protein FliW [Fibrobacter sp.]